MLGAVRGNEARGEDRDGREQCHHGGNGGVEGKHEGERHHDGKNAGRQLLEGHEQAVGEHVRVRDNAAGKVAVAVAVQVGEGQLLQMVEASAAQVERGIEGEPVGHGGKRPLADGSCREHDGDPRKRPVEPAKVDLSRSHDAVDGLTREHGQRERAHNHGNREQGGERERAAARREELRHPTDGPVGRRVVSRPHEEPHRATSSEVSWDSQISR